MLFGIEIGISKYQLHHVPYGIIVLSIFIFILSVLEIWSLINFVNFIRRLKRISKERNSSDYVQILFKYENLEIFINVSVFLFTVILGCYLFSKFNMSMNYVWEIMTTIVFIGLCLVWLNSTLFNFIRKKEMEKF